MGKETTSKSPLTAAEHWFNDVIVDRKSRWLRSSSSLSFSTAQHSTVINDIFIFSTYPLIVKCGINIYSTSISNWKFSQTKARHEILLQHLLWCAYSFGSIHDPSHYAAQCKSTALCMNKGNYNYSSTVKRYSICIRDKLACIWLAFFSR